MSRGVRNERNVLSSRRKKSLMIFFIACFKAIYNSFNTIPVSIAGLTSIIKDMQKRKSGYKGILSTVFSIIFPCEHCGFA
jgi:hypothetical protein